MAVINGKVPAAEPPKHVRRVVVKFKPDVALPYTAAAETEHAKRSPQHWMALRADFSGVKLKPYFQHVDPAKLAHLEGVALRTHGADTSKLTSYYALEVPAGSDPAALAKAAAAWPDVEIAYVEGGPTPPPVQPADDPLSASEGYLGAAPNGIDARFAWSVADGSGINLVDVERGWTLNHEDLAAANITVISGVNTDYFGHGTAVLGEIVGVDNTIGGIGIAPNCKARVVSQWRDANTYNTGDAILSGASVMKAGDVMLLEAQTSYSTAAGYVPVEVEDATFTAIQTAVAMGIVVVEAGANGSVDLDAFVDVNGKAILNRKSADFRDSGAIMVGAASSAAPHTRLGFSNYGSRIDCYAWGENIATSGDGWTGNLTNSYTPSFGGTSGASPIITGSALLLQSWHAKHGGVKTPGVVRSLLSSPVTNTKSANPADDRIGVMPNLKAIIQHGELTSSVDRLRDRYAAYVSVLFGIIQDGGGLGFTPGGKPVPVDPWGPLAPISAERRDVLLGLALTEIASLAGDERSRAMIRDAGAATMRNAMDRISARS